MKGLRQQFGLKTVARERAKAAKHGYSAQYPKSIQVMDTSTLYLDGPSRLEMKHFSCRCAIVEGTKIE